MTIIHSDQSVEVTPKSLMLLVKLNQLTDEELIYHFPKLAASRDRDGIINALVFGVKKNK
jgi:hypothetical protein